MPVLTPSSSPAEGNPHEDRFSLWTTLTGTLKEGTLRGSGAGSDLPVVYSTIDHLSPAVLHLCLTNYNTEGLT